MSGELPPQIQNQLAQLQQLQQQASAVMTQKTQIEGLIRETEAALKELEKSADDAVIYKGVGELLFKADKAKLVKTMVRADCISRMDCRQLTNQRWLWS